MLHWLSPLRLAQKFMILAALALVMLAVPTALYITDVLHNLRQARLEAAGMPPLMALNQTVQQLQVHRGTSAGMLGGDATMASRRPAVRDAVNQAFAQAQARLVEAHASERLTQALQQQQQAWESLEQAVASQSVALPQSMVQHTQLVTALLHVSEELLSAYHLTLSPHADTQALIQAALVHAPLLSENLGLLRGQGAGFLAQKHLPPENRGTLRGMQRRVSELLGASSRAMERAMQLNPDFRSALGDAVDSMRNLSNVGLKMANEQLIEAQALSLPAPQYFDILTQAIQAVNTLSDTGAAQLAQRLDSAADRLRSQFLTLVALQLLLLGGALALAWALVRSIARPLAQAMAPGGLRGEDHASAQEETAASMEAPSATVHHHTDNARDAAVPGGEVVARGVPTLQGTNDSSRKIADIIGTIDAIAFQTNILALNAAVEAARSGEPSRGLAVVAGEIRTLAAHSAAAAKEIQALIEASVSRVGQGHALAQQAGATLGDVVTAIRKATDIASTFHSASQEPTCGVSPVGEGAPPIDPATLHHADRVEEMAAAAAHLHAQGQNLVRAVSAFRWNGEGAGRTPQAPALAGGPAPVAYASPPMAPVLAH